MITDSFSISGSDPNESHLYGVYSVEHYSDIGIKYVSADNNTKITYSDRIVNIVSGRWRMALDESPFTLYYANPALTETLPLTGWVNIDEQIFTGYISETPPLSTTETIEDVTTETPTITSTETPAITSVETQPEPVPETPPVVETPTMVETSEYTGLYSNELTEVKCVYGRPTITTISHADILTGSRYAILLTGYSLNHTTNVYLSSNADMFPHESIDTHQDEKYPPISAHETTFDIVSENELIVNIPAVYKTGMIDVIVSNPAGYGKLNPTYIPISDNWTEDNLQPYIITVCL